MNAGNFPYLIAKIKESSTLLLSTHKQCDGDGLGAEMALFFALRKAGKKVRILNVDETPRKYSFLATQSWVQNFESAHLPLETTDLALIFDTNDRRLLSPLYEALENKCKEIVFIDHHPVLQEGPGPTPGSVIDVRAASTGEMVYDILQALGIELDAEIARCLYTSLVFDTHLFRYIRSSPRTHLICAELLQFEKRPEEVHRHLFADYSAERMRFLARALAKIEYFGNGQFALVRLKKEDMVDFGLDSESSRDVIDQVMNIDSLQAAVMFREDGPDEFKLSFRSKGHWQLLGVAEKMGGGGHPFAAGAYVRGPFDQLRIKVIQLLEDLARQNAS